MFNQLELFPIEVFVKGWFSLRDDNKTVTVINNQIRSVHNVLIFEQIIKNIYFKGL